MEKDKNFEWMDDRWLKKDRQYLIWFDEVYDDLKQYFETHLHAYGHEHLPWVKSIFSIIRGYEELCFENNITISDSFYSSLIQALDDINALPKLPNNHKEHMKLFYWKDQFGYYLEIDLTLIYLSSNVERTESLRLYYDWSTQLHKKNWRHRPE